MKNIQNLLNQVKIINQKNNEILDATGGRFNIFKVCGVNHYENTHSAILAEFLNPNGSHGLKHQFLQTFLEVLGVKISFNAEKAKVICEKYAPIENTETLQRGFIDIFIEDDEKNVIIIENKIDAGDQWEQLKRYHTFAQNNTTKHQIFYLTLNGKEASEHSGENVEYQCISYEKTIIEWLEKCLHISTRYPMVRETIAQYINHLKTLTYQDMDTKNQQEVAKILANDLETAQAIYQNYQTTFDFIAKKYFNPKMEKFAKEKGLEYHYFINDKNFYNHINFQLKSPKWEEKYWIEFKYYSGEYFYGLVNNEDVKYEISTENRKKIIENLEKFGKVNFKERSWFPIYENIPTLTIEYWQEDIINSDKFFQDCKKRIEEILQAMEGIDF